MIILVDQDGPLADFELALYNHMSRAGVSIPITERRGFSAAEQYEDKFGLEVAAWLLNTIRSPNFYLDLPVVPGAVDAINRLAEDADVFICTAPSRLNPTCASDKLLWVQEHLGPEWAARTIITRDKTMIRGDWLIDDRPTVDGAFVGTWEHVIFDAPYNRDVGGRRCDWTTAHHLLSS